MRACDTRLKSRQVDGYNSVILGIIIGLKLCITIPTLLCLQKIAGDFIRREYRSGYSKFCSHVCDGRTLGDREVFYPLPAILYDSSDITFRRQDLQNLKNDVFCGYPRTKFSVKLYFNHLRIGHVKGPAPHSDCNIKASRTDCDHPDSTAGWGM